MYRAPEQERMQRTMRQALPSRNRRMPMLQPHVLPAVPSNQSAPMDGVLQIGQHRKLGTEAIHYARSEASVWRLAIHSAGARAMRLHFTRFSAGAGQVWIHDGSGEEESILGPYTAKGPNGDGDFWSETVFSDQVVIEYQASGDLEPGEPVPFAIEEISHQTTPAPKATDRAAAASCHLDVTCSPDWAWTARGVARLAYEKGDGSYVCTGTLLNTRNSSFVPYLLTANHCISDNTVARTLEATWFYQKDSCNGVLSNRSFPRSLGATLMATGDDTKGDFALLKLQSVPDGVTFQGWDPNEKPLGTPVTVVHHPTGDYKRISFGRFVANANASQNFYWLEYSQGITEGGSSGSGIFSAPGVLVATLKSGLGADTQEGMCRISPYGGRMGKFAVQYAYLRQFLEDAPSSSTPSSSASGPSELKSGVPETFSIAPVTASTLFAAYTINVPQGATRLEISVRTATANVDVDLFVRFGQQVAIASGNPVADFKSDGPTGSEQLTISPTRAGAYYISLAVLTPNVAVTGTVTATITMGSGSTSSTALVSGTPRNFTLPAVTSSTLFSRDSGFKIDVPQGATRLEEKLSSKTTNTDIDLFVRYGQDPVLSGDSVATDFASTSPSGEESVVITPTSRPALQAGTYFFAIGSFTTGVRIDATITATVSTGTAPPPAGSKVLTSGRSEAYLFPAVTGPTLRAGASGYRIDVPQGATKLDIVLYTFTNNFDMDLYVRYGQDVTLVNSDLTVDYSSQGETGAERITITPTSSPALRAGTYYIALGQLTPNISVAGTITATVTMTSPGQPESGPAVLTSGVARTLRFNPLTTPAFFRGDMSYVIDVPENATRLDIQLDTETVGADVDLFVSYGKDNTLNGDRVVADFGSTGPTGNERIIITPESTPALRSGRYYISVAIYTTGTNIHSTLTATVTTNGGTTTPSSPNTLTLGQPARFSLPAVTGPTLFNGDRSFKVQIPDGMLYMKIQVTSDNPSADVDVYARFGEDVAIDGSGRVVADHAAEGPTGNELIGVTVARNPKLRAGTYYISLAAFANVPATGSIVVTATDDFMAVPNTAGRQLISGRREAYSLPAVNEPTLFAGSQAYRISVENEHQSLRVRATGNTKIYARRGQQPSVENGRLIADFVSQNGDELIVDGANLQPGVYYISLGVNSAEVGAAGEIVATLTSDGVEQADFKVGGGDPGLALDPKPAAEVRYALPVEKPAADSAGALVKQSNTIKKHQWMKVVSR